MMCLCCMSLSCARYLIVERDKKRKSGHVTLYPNIGQRGNMFCEPQRSCQPQTSHLCKMSEDFLSVVREGEILAACRALYPTTHSVLNIRAERTTPPVPGFTSLMLRVNATARSTDGTDTKVTLIYKRPTIIPQQLEMIGGMELFEREVAYFRDAVPLLQKRCPNLPLVKSFYSQEATLVLEDLDLAGFTSLVSDFKSICGADMSMPHVRLVVRSLARLHAASLGIDWPAILQQLERDAFYESDFGTNMMRPAIARSCLCIAATMKKFMDPTTSGKHAEWMQQPENYYNEISRLVHFTPGQVNVLCHGDCHANNMMFRHDEQGNPTEVKFVDLQMFRYAPPSRDLQHFLYSSTSSEFREQHETEVLQTYVEAFNAAACSTPDVLNLEAFLAEYDAARMLGVGLEITVQPMKFIAAAEMLPKPGDAMTSEQFDKIVAEPPDHAALIEMMLQQNLPFREAMVKLAQDVVKVLDKAQLV